MLIDKSKEKPTWKEIRAMRRDLRTAKSRIAELERENSALKLSHKGGDEPCAESAPVSDTPTINASSTESKPTASNAEPENVPSVSDSATCKMAVKE